IASNAKGTLQPKEPLPSVRMMAKDIGINQHTVNKTYQMLKQEGYIQIHRQKGVVIHPDGVDKADESYYQSLEASLNPMIADAICRQIRKMIFSRLSQSYIKHMNVKEMKLNELLINNYDDSVICYFYIYSILDTKDGKFWSYSS